MVWVRFARSRLPRGRTWRNQDFNKLFLFEFLESRVPYGLTLAVSENESRCVVDVLRLDLKNDDVKEESVLVRYGIK
ncbi:hypothetical protein AAMO2058_001408600 [Amorphochlora amoebiformis]